MPRKLRSWPELSPWSRCRSLVPGPSWVTATKGAGLRGHLSPLGKDRCLRRARSSTDWASQMFGTHF